ncbi:Protein of unknown function [Bacillus cytotoxicus]|nr:Protein of unknown function [Bacillus cytotoxicus]
MANHLALVTGGVLS